MRRDILTLSALLAGAMPVLGAMPAAACSCIRIAPEGFRAMADVIFEGQVLSTDAPPPHQAGITRARIRVRRVTKGQVGDPVIVVETRNQSAACGYRFRVRERREFLARFREGRYVTDSCLMIGARRP